MLLVIVIGVVKQPWTALSRMAGRCCLAKLCSDILETLSLLLLLLPLLQ
jgi:hypothetical protein